VFAAVRLLLSEFKWTHQCFFFRLYLAPQMLIFIFTPSEARIIASTKLIGTETMPIACLTVKTTIGAATT